MGLSASQARYLSLLARQSNLEYQGQQINQERTILSQQSTALYNSLLAMTVPTPPSTSDYTTVEYTGTDGASTFTLGSITPNGDTTYNINLQYTKTGHYLESAGSAMVTEVPATISVTKITAGTEYTTTAGAYEVPDATVGEGNTVADGTTLMILSGLTSASEADTDTTYYTMENGYFVPVEVTDDNCNSLYKQVTAKNATTTTDPTTGETTTTDANYDPATSYTIGDKAEYASGGISADKLTSYYVVTSDGTTRTTTANDFEELSDGTYKFKTSVGTFYSSGGSVSITNPDSTDSSITKYVDGNACMSMDSDTAKGMLGSSYSSYIQAIRDTFTEYQDGETYSDDDVAALFSVYFTKSYGSTTYIPHFMLTSDLTSNLTNVNGHSYVETYDYTANGSYTSTETKNYCQLTFDSSGRITEIKIPTSYDEDGTPTAYKSISLTATTVTDENAYNDAYNEYEYDQYLYDKKNQEINAQTEIIQQEDKNLELKLQRLDDERTQITTEIEAIEKVIDDNIESSYKTFSG